MIPGRVRHLLGLALRSADGTTGEGVGYLVEPAGNEPQVKPPQGSGCLSHAGQGVVIAPILPEVDQRGAIRVHTQVACTPGDRGLQRRLKGR